MATSLPTCDRCILPYSSASFRFRCCTDRCSGKMRPTIAAKTASTALPERRRGRWVNFFLHGIPAQVHRQVQMLKHSPDINRQRLWYAFCSIAILTKSTGRNRRVEMLAEIVRDAACCTALIFLTQSFNNGTKSIRSG